MMSTESAALLLHEVKSAIDQGEASCIYGTNFGKMARTIFDAIKVLCETVIARESEVNALRTENARIATQRDDLHRLAGSLTSQLVTLRTILTEGYSIATGDPEGGVGAPLIDIARAVCDSLAPLHAARDAALAERDEARTILEGRTTPPTSEEIAAHGGLNMWLVKFTAHSEILSGRHLAYLCEVQPPEDEEQIDRVWCLGTDGRLRAWPRVPA